MAAPGPQQTLPLRIDCGDLNGEAAVEPGWVLLGESAAPPGVSLAPAALDTVHVAAKASNGAILVPSDCWTVDADELAQKHRLTALKLADPTTLSITGLPASEPLRVRLELGALEPWADVSGTSFTFVPHTPAVGVMVEELVNPAPAQWRAVARGVRCTTGSSGNSFASNLGGIVSVWVLAHSDASGALSLRFSSTATTGADAIYLAGFEVHRHEPLPIVYHASGGQGPLVAQAPELAAFVAAFNAADYDAAEDAAAALSDGFQRGVARCWLMGWLDGSRDGRMHLAPHARADLGGAAAAHAAVPWLLSQLDELERALAHLDARGYESAKACPSAGGYGFLNPDCAGQVAVAGLQGFQDSNVNGHAALRRLAGLCTPAAGPTVRTDIDAWNAAPVAYTAWEPSPFLFTALKEYGATIAAVNPLLEQTTAQASVAFRQAFDDVFRVVLTGGGIETSHFPRDIELPLFREYSFQGVHPGQWSDATVAAVLSDAQIDASWWGPLVAKVTPQPAWPGWVAKQRGVLAAYRNASQYWLDERLRGGELGGGSGDDVEALPQLFLGDTARSEPAAPARVEDLQAIARWVLNESGDVVDGYYAGPKTDVEHSAEYTTDVFLALRGALGHVASAIETALGSTRHLREAGNPSAAWAAPTVLGRLHFKSYVFNAAGPSTDPSFAYDIPLNGRAMLPGVATGARGLLAAAHPLVADLTTWAAAWRDDALDPLALLKPVGFFGPIGWSLNLFGGAGSWWTIGTSPADTAVWGGADACYTLELLRMAYRNSTAADRWRFLLPAVRVFRSVQAWELAGKPTTGPFTQPGQAWWAAASFFNSARFHALVVSHLNDLATDPVLTVVDDPDVLGLLPYVDVGLTSRLKAWAEDVTVGGVNQALRYALRPVQPCGLPSQVKSTLTIESGYDNALAFYRAVFPMLTRRVMHTDRLFMNRSSTLMGNLLAAHTGAGLVEGQPYRPRVRWIVPAGSWSVLSILCNRLDYDGTQYGAFVHSSAATPIAVELALDEGLLPGTYRLEIGAAGSTCDEFPATSTVTTMTVSKRGAGALAPLVVQPGLQLVRVTRIGGPDIPAQAYDLTLDAPRFRLRGSSPQSSGLFVPLAVVRVRVVNAGSAASPPATLRLYSSAADPGAVPAAAVTGFDTLFATAAIPALAGSSGFTLNEHLVTVALPLDEVALTAAGASGLRVRAQIVADGLEWDPLNNGLSRTFPLHDLVDPWSY